MNKISENANAYNRECNFYTVESIQIALISLMRNKDIDDISITELVEKSGVSRSAFYRNYKNKVEVLLDFSSNIFDIIRNSLYVKEYSENHYEWFLFVFRHIKDNRKTIELLIKGKIKEIGVRYFRNAINLNSEFEYEILAFEDGINAIIKKWIANDMKESCEQMAEMCVKIFPQISIYFNEKIEK